jgi:hypothetical protein
MLIGAADGWGKESPYTTGVVTHVAPDSRLVVRTKTGGRLHAVVENCVLVARTADAVVIPNKEVSMTPSTEAITLMADKVRGLYDLPTGALPDVVEQGLRNKAPLNEILGHNAENAYRTVIDLPTTEEDWEDEVFNTRLKRSLVAHMGWDSTRVACHKNEYIDERSNKRKITKLVLAALKDGAHPLHAVFAGYGWEPQQIGQRLGECMAARASEDVIVISTNLFDYLTSSGDYWNLAAFGSCHGRDGCHFNGNLAYWNDDLTILAYVAPRDRIEFKIGRSWVYIPQPRTALVQAKSYGTFAPHLRKRMREHIEARLDLYLDLKGTGGWRKRRGRCDSVSGPGVHYLDNYDMDIAYHTGVFPLGFTGEDVPTLEFQRALCLACGAETIYTTGGACDSCNREYYCCNCDDMVSERNRWSNSDGEIYCEGCYNQHYVSCDHCEREVQRDYAREHGGEYYCEGCFEDLFWTCDTCGDSFDADEPSVAIRYSSYCPHCAEDKGYRQCEECEGWTQDYVTTQDTCRDICSECLGDFTRCTDCGDWYEDGGKLRTVENTGKSVCSACADDYVQCAGCEGLFEATEERDGEQYCWTCFKEMAEAVAA